MQAWHSVTHSHAQPVFTEISQCAALASSPWGSHQGSTSDQGLNDQDSEEEELKGGPGVTTQNGLSDSPKLNTCKSLTKQNKTQVFCFLAKMLWNVYTMDQLREGGKSNEFEWIWFQFTEWGKELFITVRAWAAAAEQQGTKTELRYQNNPADHN